MTGYLMNKKKKGKLHVKKLYEKELSSFFVQYSKCSISLQRGETNSLKYIPVYMYKKMSHARENRSSLFTILWSIYQDLPLL